MKESCRKNNPEFINDAIADTGRRCNHGTIAVFYGVLLGNRGNAANSQTIVYLNQISNIELLGPPYVDIYVL